MIPKSWLIYYYENVLTQQLVPFEARIYFLVNSGFFASNYTSCNRADCFLLVIYQPAFCDFVLLIYAKRYKIDAKLMIN